MKGKITNMVSKDLKGGYHGLMDFLEQFKQTSLLG
jgi:hypothetical protein